MTPSNKTTLPISSTPSIGIEKARIACHRIPPCWPLKNFVAVNPFMGLLDHHVMDVCALMKRVIHQDILMKREYFRDEIEEGKIFDQDLSKAIHRARLGFPAHWQEEVSKLDVADMTQWLHYPETLLFPEDEESRVLSVTDVLDQMHQTFWSEIVQGEISKWCAAYYDEGQSSWRMPWSNTSLFEAWKQAASIDASMEVHGLRNFRKFVASLPDDPLAVIDKITNEIGLSETGMENYFHRLLVGVNGWSGFVQYLVREKGMKQEQDDSLLDLLAIRLCYEQALYAQHSSPSLISGFSGQFSNIQVSPKRDTVMRMLWQMALEEGYQRVLLAQLQNQKSRDPENSKSPSLQMVFCIDVRSEVMRRNLETASSEIETLGFAGFFGMPIEFIPFGERHGTSQCPVLLTPKFKVREKIKSLSPEQEIDMLKRYDLAVHLKRSWAAFKSSAVSCFSFVETVGVGYIWKLLDDAWFAKIKSKDTSTCLQVNAESATQEPCQHHDHALNGICLEDRIQLAFQALKNMGLTQQFAPLVLFCGHGSQTKNNPYGTSLDCGACGGHAGHSNARTLAALLNQAEVREGLKLQQIFIPQNTHFMAGLHDTTTDHITLFDEDEIPQHHRLLFAELKLWLNEAETETRKQRAVKMGLHCDDTKYLEKGIIRRGSDWSEVRPEWGLAGNAAFIVAPRERTRGLDLEGRTFLHNYHSESDPSAATLELIMTAPMIVASWINWQYYASTVNNTYYGSGNKVIHNVVGTLGVMQGNGGDIRTGLPLQSLHDGERWMHEPLRLTVIIEADRHKVEQVLSKHPQVRQMLDHSWLHLFVLENDAHDVFRYLGSNEWINF